ncbi:MAG TPA: SPW repeat protein [Nitrolancea sp.]|nr:SPW repeat protein [Nitrolancea sp.]
MATQAPPRPSTLRLLPVINMALGIWLLASPYVLGFTLIDAARINNATFGPFILWIAIARLAVPDRGRWVSWFNVAFGIWVAASPFVLGFADQPKPMINNIVVGLIVALVALVSTRQPRTR